MIVGEKVRVRISVLYHGRQLFASGGGSNTTNYFCSEVNKVEMKWTRIDSNFVEQPAGQIPQYKTCSIRASYQQ